MICSSERFGPEFGFLVTFLIETEGIILKNKLSKTLFRLKDVKGLSKSYGGKNKASIKPPTSPSQPSKSYVYLFMIVICLLKAMSMLVNLYLPVVFFDG